MSGRARRDAPALWQVVSGIQDQEFTVTDVIEGKEYLFRVSACNKCGAGEPAYMDEPVNVSSPASQFQHRHSCSCWFQRSHSSN